MSLSKKFIKCSQKTKRRADIHKATLNAKTWDEWLNKLMDIYNREGILESD